MDMITRFGTRFGFLEAKRQTVVVRFPTDRTVMKPKTLKLPRSTKVSLAALLVRFELSVAADFKVCDLCQVIIRGQECNVSIN